MNTKNIKQGTALSCSAASTPATDPQLPELTVLSTQELDKLFDEFEENEHFQLNRKAVLGELVDCLHDLEESDYELQYYSAYLAHSQDCERLLLAESQRLSKAVMLVGERLRMLLCYYDLYRRGVLPYRLVRLSGGRLVLMRADVFMKALHHEVKNGLL